MSQASKPELPSTCNVNEAERYNAWLMRKAHPTMLLQICQKADSEACQFQGFCFHNAFRLSDEIFTRVIFPHKHTSRSSASLSVCALSLMLILTALLVCHMPAHTLNDSACVSCCLLLSGSSLGWTGLLGHPSRLAAGSRNAQPFTPQALVVRGFRIRRRFRRLRLLPALRATPRLVRQVPATGKSSSSERFPAPSAAPAHQVSPIWVFDLSHMSLAMQCCCFAALPKVTSRSCRRDAFLHHCIMHIHACRKSWCSVLTAAAKKTGADSNFPGVVLSNKKRIRSLMHDKSASSFIVIIILPSSVPGLVI